jgi:hypothetical protein
MLRLTNVIYRTSIVMVSWIVGITSRHINLEQVPRIQTVCLNQHKLKDLTDVKDTEWEI